MLKPMFFSNLRILCYKFSSFTLCCGADNSPVSGVKERIEGMLRRYGELTEEVGGLETLVEDQRKDLEMQNSSRFGGIYDDIDDGSVVTQTMVVEEEEKVRQLEEKIKSMQEKVIPLE